MFINRRQIVHFNRNVENSLQAFGTVMVAVESCCLLTVEYVQCGVPVCHHPWSHILYTASPMICPCFSGTSHNEHYQRRPTPDLLQSAPDQHSAIFVPLTWLSVEPISDWHFPVESDADGSSGKIKIVEFVNYNYTCPDHLHRIRSVRCSIHCQSYQCQGLEEYEICCISDLSNTK